jgi:hypothetical protein
MPPSMGREGAMPPDPRGRGPCSSVNGLGREGEGLPAVGERAREREGVVELGTQEEEGGGCAWGEIEVTRREKP